MTTDNIGIIIIIIIIIITIMRNTFAKGHIWPQHREQGIHI